MTDALGTSLEQARADPDRFLDRLVAGARRALPIGAEGALEVEAERTLRDRVTGRPGRLVGLRLTGHGHSLSLRRVGPGWNGEIAVVVGGVTIARRSPPLGAWLDAFAGEIAVLAAESAGDATAAGRALAALGLQPPVDGFGVDPEHLVADLRSLPERAGPILPPEAAALLERICLRLAEAAESVGDDPAPLALVRRTAVTYLPDTLRAFTTLPTDWARTRTLLDGSTAEQALLDQLTNLDEAAARMRDAAVADDANALLLNGLFLADRFGGEERAEG